MAEARRARTHVKWLQELFVQEFAGMGLNANHTSISSMIVANFDALRACFGPDKADPPLVVNTNAMLSGSVTP